jgi:hypothetical protein
MDWMQPMVYSEEFSRKERPNIEEYYITHDEQTGAKVKNLNEIFPSSACWNIIVSHPCK